MTMSNSIEIALQLAEDCGFAISTMKAFLSSSGTTGEAVDEAIRRLENSGANIAEFIREQRTKG